MSDGTPIETVLSRLSGVRPSGDSGNRWSACCPTHDDASNSLGVWNHDNGVVTLKCFAGCDKLAIVKAIDLEWKDLFPNKREKKPKAGVTVQLLAFEKRLPPEYLKSCGFESELTDANRWRVLMAYKDEAGGLLFNRQRRSLDGKFRFWQPKGKPQQTYGKWRLPEFRAAGNVLILVEGETDTVTLWFHGYPCLGVPGSQAVGAVTKEDLEGFEVFYVWKDGKKKDDDASGEKFAANLAARIKQIRPGCVIRSIQSPDGAAYKDPNELNQRHQEDFKSRFDAILAAAGDAPKIDAAILATASASGTPGALALTDMGNARRLIAQHGEDLRYSHPQDTWYIWAGNRWEPDDTGEIVRRAKKTVLGIFLEAADVESAKQREEIARHAIASQSSRSLSNMIQVSKSEPGIPVCLDDLDVDPWFFNCPNGTVNLKTGDLQQHRREDLVTQISPIEFDPKATCPLWDSFLAKVFPVDPTDPSRGPDEKLIGYVQRLFGYGLTGDIREHTLPIFWGGGSNGKSTMIETIALVFGSDYWAAAPDGMLMVRRTEAHPTELARLYRKRFVAATETDEGQRLNASLVKRLTGGDKITARFMRENFFEFPPTHKLLMGTNDRPRIVSSGHAIWRRVALVPFEVKFWKPELGELGPDYLQADTDLPERLKAELPGILAWMVRGCLEWQRIGLDPPDKIRVATGKYREQQNTIGSFLTECCEVSNSAGSTTIKDLYSAYRAWAESNSETPIGKIRFNDAISKENIHRDRDSSNLDVWNGLRITKNTESSGASGSRSFADYGD